MGNSGASQCAHNPMAASDLLCAEMYTFPLWAWVGFSAFRNHTSNIYRKLHIFDRTQAVIYAIREGVIDVEELEYHPPREF